MTPGRAGPPLNLSSPCLGSPPPPDPQLYQVATDVLQPPPPPPVLTHAALPVLFCITGLLSWPLPAHCVPHM